MAMNPPPPIDSQILQFKELFKLKTLSDTSKGIYRQPTQLIVSASNYGVIFIGERNGIKAILTNKLYEEEIPKLSRNIVDEYIHRNVPLSSMPSHMDISSDQKRLAVTYCQDNSPVLRIYSVESFFQANVTVFNEVRLSATDGTFVVDLSWNPAIPNIISCCISDGTLSVYTFFDNGVCEIKSLPSEKNSTCVCWSRKGKQIVVGNGDGFLTRYSPELTPVQQFDPPTAIFDKPCTLCSVKWLSTFQFICVYKLQENYKNEDGSDKLSVIVVNTPKNAPVQYINYEDPCFSSGSERPSQFYFIHVPRWSLIFVASSNGVELAVLGLNADGVSWSLWNLDEGTKIVLPMCKGEETFPVGVCMDYSSQIQTPVGDNIVSSPTLSLLTSEGLLCVYLINNFNPSLPSICEKAAVVPCQYFQSSNVVDERPPAIVATPVTPVAQNLMSAFAGAIPTPTSRSASSPARVVPTPPKDSVHVPAFAPVSSEPHPQISIPPSSTLANLLSASSSNTGFVSAVSSESHPQINIPPNATLANLLSTSSSLFHANTSAYAMQMMLSAKTTLPTLTKSNIEVTAAQQPIQIETTPDIIAEKLAADAANAKIEQMKKFRKIAQTFETEIGEIIALIETIKIENNKSSRAEKHDQLLENIKTLKISNTSLSADVDLMKQLIIETFALVQDIKTKHWQYTNAGYRNLTNIQDLDTTSQNRLKSIENSVNYARSQIDKANKLLDEIWFKFYENNARSAKNKMQVPLVDNIYETIVKQQKIFKMLQLRTQQYEKKIHSVELLVAKTHPTKSPVRKSVDYALQKDSYSASLIKSTANLRIADDDEEDPRTLARKLCVQHAKRFHLSMGKRLKLQELHSGINDITFIQSNRLQKLKKKSLIMLSKSSHAEETPPSIAPPTPVAVASKPSPVNESRARAFSPISSDEFDVKTADEKIVSSTPVKAAAPKATFNVETLIESSAVSTCGFGFGTESIITTLPLSIAAADARAKTPEMQIKPVQSPLNVETKTTSAASATTNATKPSIFASAAITNKNPAVTSTIGLFSPSALAAAATTSAIAATSAPKTDVTAATFSFSLPKSQPSTPPSMPMPSSISMLSAISLPSSTSMFAGQGVAVKPQMPMFKTLSESTTNSAAPSFVSTGTPSLFGGTGSIFKPKTTATTSATTIAAATAAPSLANTINFGSILSSNLTLGGAKTTGEVAPTATKGDTFSTFSFANIKSSEITQPVAATVAKAEPVLSKETASPSANLAAPNLTFSSISSFTPIRTSAPASSTFTMPTAVKPASAETPEPILSLSNPVLSNISNNVVITAAETIPLAVTTTASSENVVVSPAIATSSFLTSSVTIAPIATTTAPQITMPFENGSFLGELNLGSASAAVAPVATSSAPSVVFGNLPTASTSTSSLFRSGGNIFTQNTMGAAAAPANTGETKLLFGRPSMFEGQSNTATGATTATSVEKSGAFDTSQNTGTSFTGSGQGSLFGSSSIFGGGASFAATTTESMSNSFAPANTSSGSLFGGGSLFSNSFSGSPFQNTTGTGAFGNLSFANTPQQSQESTSGFGAPPAFSGISAFNKPAFGGAPTFGGSPTFGTSPPKLFGQTAVPTSTFGSAAPSQPTVFENIASENTMTFGNLAQQTSGFGSPQTFNQTNTQPSFTGSSFGGNAFSSWR